ncbi:MAG: hypothetical protein OER90_12770 [Gemmatimonadota bacterium]|nr:hypothetical protein [Gemmatimonadota bacterium]
MTRRYNRNTTSLAERVDTHIEDFPQGDGPPLYLTTKYGAWKRLGPGQGHLVPVGRPEGGAFAFGLTTTAVFIWAYLPADAPGSAYCYHGPRGPVDPRIHTTALAQVGCRNVGSSDLYVVIASHRGVESFEERFFLDQGVQEDRVFAYSNCLLSQFGISATGCVGEAR